jgi:hypothetical protein
VALLVAFSASFQLYSLAWADDGTQAPLQKMSSCSFFGAMAARTALMRRSFWKVCKTAIPLLVIEQYEVWYVPENRAKLQAIAEELGFEPQYVPVTIVGDQYWVGFSEIIAEEIEQAVTAGIENLPVEARANVINIPLIGRVNLDQQSLLMSTCVDCFRRWCQSMLGLGADHAAGAGDPYRLAPQDPVDRHHLSSQLQLPFMRSLLLACLPCSPLSAS